MAFETLARETELVVVAAGVVVLGAMMDELLGAVVVGLIDAARGVTMDDVWVNGIALLVTSPSGIARCQREDPLSDTMTGITDLPMRLRRWMNRYCQCQGHPMCYLWFRRPLSHLK